MTVRLKKKQTDIIVGEPIKASDFNDTMEYLAGRRFVKNITDTYTVQEEDSLLVLKPNNSANTYTNISLGGGYFYGDKNIFFDGTYIYFQASTGAQGFGRFNVTTWAFTFLTTGSMQGITCLSGADDYLFFVNYTTTFYAMNKTGGSPFAWVTLPANVYSVCWDAANACFYLAGYSGILYKVTRGSVITTLMTSTLWTNTIVSMWCDSSSNIYVTTGSASWRVTNGIPYSIANVIPNVPAYYNSSDNSIYYKRQINGWNYFCKYSFSTETETILTKAQYGGNNAFFFQNDWLIEGNSAGPNQASYLYFPTSAKVLSLKLPAPSNTWKDKEVLISAPYGFTNAPVIEGKMLIDAIPTNNDIIYNSLFLPISLWGSNNRTVRAICDGINWLLFRN